MIKELNLDFDFEFDKSMIWITIMMAILPPIGVIMLLKKLKGFKRGKNEQKKVRNVGITTMICSVAYMLLGIGKWAAMALICGLGLTVFSELSLQKEKRFRRYLAVIGGRSPVALAELAARCDESVEQVERDLKTMIEQGYFGLSTYIDHNRHCIVLDGVDDFSWNSPFEKSEKEQSGRAAESQKSESRSKVIYVDPEPEEQPDSEKKDESRHEKKPDKKAERKQEQDDQFGRKLSEIRELNDRIADPVISAKIDRIEGITSHIFEIVRRKPEKLNDIRKFMNYYLPTTLKLLDSYALLEEQGIEGDNITASKEQINQILDTLIQSFEKQLDMLFTAQAMDISTDIDVLEKMMAADGLKGSDFTLKPQTRK